MSKKPFKKRNKENQFFKTLNRLWLKIKPGGVHPLRAQKIRFSYGGAESTEILKGLNLSVKTSQIIAVVGKSGSGKTTFLNIVSGVISKRHKGAVSVHGNTNLFAKEDIGYVPQEFAFVPDLTIKENFEFFGKLNGLNKHESVKSGELFMETLQLRLPMSRYPAEISGGQKTRLNIIISLLHNPKVIILDEPFVGLDYYNRKLLWHFFEHQKNRRKTIIVTTHMLTEAEHHANKIVLLHNGKIFARGKMDEIRRKLNTRYIVEVKFSYVSKTALESIKQYCANHEVKILDFFNNYLMISVMGEGQRNYFFKHLDKLSMDYKEIGFREPNLDELFLKVRSV